MCSFEWELRVVTSFSTPNNYCDIECVADPLFRCFKVYDRNKSLVAFGSTDYRQKEVFEIWNYKKNICCLEYHFDNMRLTSNRKRNNSLNEQDSLINCNCISPFTFSPEAKFLLVRYQKDSIRNHYCLLQLWKIETGKLIQETDNLPLLAVHTLANSHGKIIASGIREDKVCVWELQTDTIIKFFPYVSPTLLTADGRIFIYCNDRHDIVVYDLDRELELVTLKGHIAPIGYLAMSSNREFIASYSVDKTIRIWGIP